jgi:MFS family permease
MRAARLPFFYGWVIVGVAFVTMGLSVNARTAFSLFLPPLIEEFGWSSGLTAGAFSFGFLVSALMSPVLGRWVDRYGPRPMIESGVALLAAGLMLAPLVHSPWQLYATLGVLVIAGGNCLGYTAHALFLTNWFVRRRGLAISLAFSGVGVGSILLMPWLQSLVGRDGWRAACFTMGVAVLAILAPLNLLLTQRPGDLGLEPDGDSVPRARAESQRTDNVVDRAWAAVDWTLGSAMRTGRFWWIAIGYFCGMFAWYAVQVHQTRYLIEIGISPSQAAMALGLVSFVAIPGQILLGHLSDRIGREWVWTAGCLGFVLCYAALLLLRLDPGPGLLYLMVCSQGALGYGITSVIGAIPAEIFDGPRYGTIYGALMVSAIAGGAAGPWTAGVLFDATGSYASAFVVAIGVSGLSALAIWLASPRKVHAVAGRIHRLDSPASTR